MVYIFSAIVNKCYDHQNPQGRRAFVVIVVFVVIVDLPRENIILWFSSFPSLLSNYFSFYSPSMSISLCLSTSLSVSLLVLILLLRQCQRSLNKSPYPPPLYLCCSMIVRYLHPVFYCSLSTFSGM